MISRCQMTENRWRRFLKLGTSNKKARFCKELVTFTRSYSSLIFMVLFIVHFILEVKIQYTTNVTSIINKSIFSK